MGSHLPDKTQIAARCAIRFLLESTVAREVLGIPRQMLDCEFVGVSNNAKAKLTKQFRILAVLADRIHEMGIDEHGHCAFDNLSMTEKLHIFNYAREEERLSAPLDSGTMRCTLGWLAEEAEHTQRVIAARVGEDRSPV